MLIGHTELDEALGQLGRLKWEIEKRESRARVTLEICQISWDLCKKQWDFQFSSVNDVADFLRVFPASRRLDFNDDNDELRDTLFDAEVFMLTPTLRRFSEKTAVVEKAAEIANSMEA